MNANIFANVVRPTTCVFFDALVVEDHHHRRLLQSTLDELVEISECEGRFLTDALDGDVDSFLVFADFLFGFF